MGTGMITLVIGIIAFIFALGCVYLFRWIDRRRADSREQPSTECKQDRFSEENVSEEQLRFERHLEDNANLSDGVHGRESYVYKSLMSKWFAILVTKYRDNESMSKKLRRDWLSYMNLLQHHSMLIVFAEKSTSAKRTAYDRDAWEAKKSYMAIEDAFAEEIGKDAIEELQRIRAAPVSS